MHHLIRITVVCCILFGALGCSDEPTNPSTSAALTITGTLDNPTNIAIPTTAKIVVIWGVSATSPDYAYIYGSGSIDRANGTFRVELPAMPPDSAFNARGSDPANSSTYRRLGVGFVTLYDDPNNLLQTGVAPFTPPAGVRPYGAINNTAIIYRKGTDGAFEDFVPWVLDFPEGFSLGRGVEIPNEPDGFEPIPNVNVKFMIDTVLSSFTFPEWT